MPTILIGVIIYIAPETIQSISTQKLGNTNQLLHFGFKEYLLLLVFILTFLLPGSIIYYLHKIGIVKTLKMEELKSRRVPYFASFIIYLFLGFFIKFKLPILHEISILLFSTCFCLFLVFLISLFWQISAHMVGIGGALGVFLGIYIKFGTQQLFIPILATLILVGLLASARLKLNAHNMPQIIAGLILGSFISCISILYFL
jgi:membrane-associated phospholipid phosphatase